MIKLLEDTLEDIMEIRIAGKINQEDYDIINPTLEKITQEYKHPKAYVEISDVDIPTLQMVWEEFQKTPDFKKLEKCAVIASKEWQETFDKLYGNQTNPKVKYFHIDEKARAKSWLKS
ncbi:MAG: STAS/SEC14 domain-containing protein [Bacteroidota bacterium]|nr:STAS/SEC14 domain-containing protein [Bacteroidota bacterium]